jgi:putative sterol carrier protein
MTGPTAFTAEWADAWCRALNESDAYRTAGAQWEGDVVLVMTAEGDAPARAVHLDLHHGQCRGGRMATAADYAEARYVMEAGPATWRELLGGRTAPLMALLSGRLRLTRGNLAALVPFAGAAGELVATAVAMNSDFPAEL